MLSIQLKGTFAVLVLAIHAPFAAAEDMEVAVGSKKFTESVILGELCSQLAGSTGARAQHRAELGGTRVLWNALLKGDIDLYPEYTGTISQEILKDLTWPAALHAEAPLCLERKPVSREHPSDRTKRLRTTAGGKADSVGHHN